MVRMLVHRFALLLAALVATLAITEQFNPEPLPLLVDAGIVRGDYERCVLVRPGPIQPRKDLPQFRKKGEIT